MTLNEELEILTGRVVPNNITPVVYHLLKDSCNNLSKAQIRELIKEGQKLVLHEPTNINTDIHSIRGCSLEEFLRRCKRV